MNTIKKAERNYYRCEDDSKRYILIEKPEVITFDFHKGYEFVIFKNSQGMYEIIEPITGLRACGHVKLKKSELIGLAELTLEMNVNEFEKTLKGCIGRGFVAPID